MEQETNQFVQAIVIASDPTQGTLHRQAIEYLSTIQQNAGETWRLALNVFVEATPQGSRKHPAQARFFALRVLDEFLESKYETPEPEAFQALQQTFLSYVSSEYIFGSAEANAPFLRNKFSHTLALLFLATYIDQWPTFFPDLFALMRPAESSSQTPFNAHVSILFFHVVLEISGEVADQIVKSARTWTNERHARDARVRDAVRERDAAHINQAVLTIVADNAARVGKLRKDGVDGRELNEAVEVIDLGMRAFGSYVGWVDINLTVTAVTVPLLFSLLSDPSLPIRVATSISLLRIVSKGLKEPSDKLQLIKVLSLDQVLKALEEKTRAEHDSRKSQGAEDEGEESYREALGKLLNTLGIELIKLLEDSIPETVRVEAEQLLQRTLPTMLQFMADEYDDTCSTVFPMLQAMFGHYKKMRKAAPEPLDPDKRTFLSSLLGVILQKMKWDEDTDADDMDEDDRAAFEVLRKDLRSFMDAVLAIDQDLVVEAIRSRALETLSMYRSGASVSWTDAELAVYLIYIYGEINKGMLFTGTKGRGAFVQAPAVPKEKRKEVNYSEFPLTLHGELVFALIESHITMHPHQMVVMQAFEAIARYTDFFKVRKECIIPVLEAMVGPRGLRNIDKTTRSRVFYLFHKFIKECRNEIPLDLAGKLINSVRDVLTIQVELPESDAGEPESPLVQLADAAAVPDPQLYIFEAVGALISLFWKAEEQPTIMLSVVRPLLDELQQDMQAVKGIQDVLPIVKMHHVVMALGNIAKGFPDFPSPVPEGYVFSCMPIFREIAQAIITSLEAMKFFKVVRDASRFAFTRILATTGHAVTDLIPPLMVNLLAEFEPSELVDFLNFLNLLVHRLQGDLFGVLDDLFTPLSVHISGLMSQPVTGTDDALSRGETKRTYITFLANMLSSKLQGVYLSNRNKDQFEQVLQSMLRIAEDYSDPQSQKIAFTFLSKSVPVWSSLPDTTATPNGDMAPSQGLPGYERFIYDNVVPLVFRVLASPEFNIKDGQVLVILQEIANLLQAIGRARKQEAHEFFLSVFLPSQNWPADTALDFTTKMRDLDTKAFRKYFTDFVRASRSSP
ncbi:ARM repeat-containing protein [Vararia minispora EC-137]|uniref:ARM repeat-containing protein n=1 Tax=Vararia minispora EC-137 TaxID=1314806 RepID=A0ACB8QPY4_9AGAM|nr:ARM repeat-containing protein [Vararia minispora EC-137]